jgi:hypothetical protein
VRRLRGMSCFLFLRVLLYTALPFLLFRLSPGGEKGGSSPRAGGGPRVRQRPPRRWSPRRTRNEKKRFVASSRPIFLSPSSATHIIDYFSSHKRTLLLSPPFFPFHWYSADREREKKKTLFFEGRRFLCRCSWLPPRSFERRTSWWSSSVEEAERQYDGNSIDDQGRARPFGGGQERWVAGPLGRRALNSFPSMKR